MPQIDLRKPGRPIKVGVILMGGMTEILDVAPVDLLHSLDKSFIEKLPNLAPFANQALDMEFYWVNEHKTPAKLTAGITILPTDSFQTCPPLDIVLMGAHWGHECTTAELEFVRKAYNGCSAYLSICGGMMVPLQAGVLDGKTCTAPLIIIDGVRKKHPQVKWVEKRYVKDADGKTWTSGTLLNGLDLMRAFVDDTWGGEGTLVRELVKTGAWPVRDVDYKDA